MFPQDTDEFILPTGANKTRGRFELAFFTIGGCCITGIFISSSSHVSSSALYRYTSQNASVFVVQYGTIKHFSLQIKLPE